MTATEDRPAPTIVRAACPHDCPDTCAMLVTVADGRATEVRGDPDHPFTRGSLCVKVNNYVDKVYSPDRLLHPLRRVGPKGSERFERISWDAALDEIAERFRASIAEHGPTSIMPEVSYLGTEGILNGLNVGDPFFNKLGATISERTYCDSGSITAYSMTIGATAGVDPESLVHSRYIVIWACNMISTNLHLWPVVAEAQRRGAKVVVIDPVRHRTAQHADWYLPIRPGTDAALALALMHVIIDEGLVDEEYVRDHTVGYDELAERVRQHTPEWAAQETGIPADDIRTLAREYATSQPSMIRIGVAIERHAGGGQTVRAIVCLPALVGAWRNVGGGLLQLPLWAFPVNWGGLMHPELATAGTRVVNEFLLGRGLTGGGLDPPLLVSTPPVWPRRKWRAAWPARTFPSAPLLTDTPRPPAPPPITAGRGRAHRAVPQARGPGLHLFTPRPMSTWPGRRPLPPQPGVPDATAASPVHRDRAGSGGRWRSATPWSTRSWWPRRGAPSRRSNTATCRALPWRCAP